MAKKIKFIGQDNIMDCGIACLLMMIKHYGGNNSMENLRLLSKTGKNGTTAFHLIETAKKLGFEAKGYRCSTISDINKFPCIAHLIINKSYHHFVVIDMIDFNKKLIVVIDPAIGKEVYSFNDFDEVWTKIILILAPTKEIVKKEDNKQLKKLTIDIIKPYYKNYIFVIFLSLFLLLLNIINTFYIKLVIDNESLNIYYLFYFFIIIIIIKTGFDYVRNKLLININFNIDKNLINNVYSHIISLPYSYFNTRQTGDIIARFNDLNYFKELISKVSALLIIDFILIIVAFIILFFINNILFLLYLFFLVLYLILALMFLPKFNQNINLLQESNAMLSTYMVESIKAVDTIKGLKIEKEVKVRFKEKYNQLLKNNYKLNNLINSESNIKNFLSLLFLSSIIFLGSTFIKEGKIEVGELILFYTMLIYFLEPIKNIFNTFPLIYRAFNSYKRIKELFYIKKEYLIESQDEIMGDIKFNNLSFSYDDITYIFKDFNLHITKGSVVLLCGSSGSGKSTLIKLMLKYFKVDDNNILINNIDINDCSLTTIRNSICYISQSESLFTDSIYDNIILGRNISNDEFLEICKLVYIDNILQKRNIDYNYIIQEDGANLSGGERQRIILARGLLKKANIFILDETLNEVDVDMERKIIKNIKNKFIDKTFIVISHRLNNKDLYDKTICF